MGIVAAGARRVHVRSFSCPLPSRQVTGFPLPGQSRSGLLLCGRKGIDRDVFGRVASCLPRNSLVMFGGAQIVRTHLLFRGRAKTGVRVFYLRPIRPRSCTLIFRRARYYH